MKREYLPSRKFGVRVVAIVVLIALIFGLYELVILIRNRLERPRPTNQTGIVIKDIVQKDSNNNGIPDWEESLWGLDPTKNGDSNKEFILAKRQALAQSADAGTTASQSSPENQALTQEFFATIVSLQQTGNLDPTSLQAISDAMGQQIVADPIADVYTASMVTTVGATDEARYDYITAYANLITKYKDANIGSELSFISTALKDNDPGALTQVQKIADNYRAFGKDLINTPAPTTIAPTEVSLANNYEKTAQSIEGMEQLLSDPIVGMKALINYKRYNDALINDINILSDKFSQE